MYLLQQMQKNVKILKDSSIFSDTFYISLCYKYRCTSVTVINFSIKELYLFP